MSSSGSVIPFAIAGSGMGAGLLVSAMASPMSSYNFFNLLGIDKRLWDPSMLLVFTSALAVNAIAYYTMRALRKKPFLSDKFCTPAKTELTPQLLFGAMLFGCGWALAGLCPGPGVVGLFLGQISAVAFCFGMFSGFFLRFVQSGRNTLNKLSFGTTLSLALVGVGLAASSSSVIPTVQHKALPFDWTRPVMGGSIIGTSVAFLMLFNGRILGLSGIFKKLVDFESTEQNESWAFVGGMMMGAYALMTMFPSAISYAVYEQRPLWTFLLGGILVGYGTDCANGCTSGHGLSGLTRVSKRSIAATAMFFCTNMLVSTLLAYTIPSWYM